MGWYKHWFGTRYYTLLYGHRDDADAAEWVRTILGRWRLDPGARVLDLACGRGRHVKHFVKGGFDTTGVDISRESIEDARALVPRAAFHVADMRTVVAREAFDGICCLFTSLGYFTTKQDDQLVFDAVAASLKPKGRFVLDFMNTEAVVRDLVAQEELHRDGVGFTIRRELVDEIIVKRIAVTDGDQQHQFEERVQALRPDELIAMAEAAGLVVERLTDGPVPVPFDPQRSDRFVLWAYKP